MHERVNCHILSISFTDEYSEAYSVPCHTSKIELFAAVNYFRKKNSVLDAWQDSEYSSRGKFIPRLNFEIIHELYTITPYTLNMSQEKVFVRMFNDSYFKF